MAKEKKVRDANDPRLPFGKFMAWKSSDVSAAGVNWIINSYMMIFCTNALGMDPVGAGTLLLVCNIIDAITDLIVGYLIDITPFTKFGKCRPYELGIFGMTLGTVLLFACPAQSTELLKWVWVFVAYNLIFGIFNTARNGANVPYMVRAFDNNKNLIGKVSAFGGFVTTMGAAVITMTFPKLIAKFGDGTAASLTPEMWKKIILIYMIPLTVIAIFRVIFVKENPEIDAGASRLKLKLSDIFAMLRENPYVWAYGLMIFAFNVVQNLGATAYYFDYIVGSQDMMGIISIFSYILMPLLFVLPWLMKKLGAAKIVFYSALLALGGYVINFFAGKSVPMLFAGTALTALVMLPISYLGNVLMVNIFDYTEFKGLPRQEATTYAIGSSIFSQLGQGVGPFLVGILLKASGFVESVGGVAMEQPDSAIFTIRCLYSLIPLALLVLVAIGARIQTRLEKKLPEIETVLAEKRAANIAENAAE